MNLFSNIYFVSALKLITCYMLCYPSKEKCNKSNILYLCAKKFSNCGVHIGLCAEFV